MKLTWVGGADAYHQFHPVSDPPVEHPDDILINAGVFHRRWGRGRCKDGSTHSKVWLHRVCTGQWRWERFRTSVMKVTLNENIQPPNQTMNSEPRRGMLNQWPLTE